MRPFGILNLNKPPRATSRDVVNRVQRLARPAKVGHAGTLDPLATGVLVVTVGPATRLTEYVQRMAKRYRATFLLGRTSPTEDIDGAVTELANPPVPTREEIARAAARLTGKIEQRPPAFSALKIGGRRAYDLARRGEAVELEPRTVEVYGLEIEEYVYPELRLAIACSSGTYVRSLGRDLAESLGSGAVMSALVRTAIGCYRLEEAIGPETLTAENWRAMLRPPLEAVSELCVELTAAEVRRVATGLAIEPPELGDAEEAAAVDESGRLVAILSPRGGGLWGPKLNFAPALN